MKMNNSNKIKINGETKLYGIIGNPVKHSFSPGMQTTAFQTIGINAVYLPFQITEEELPNLLDSFSLINLQGFNVTVPFKQKIIPFLSEIDPDAKLLDSVNTVVRTKTGWKGYSTDGKGFIRSLKDLEISLPNTSAAIVGAGGSARAIAISLVQSGVSEILIFNRTESKAHDLAKLIKQLNHEVHIKINPIIKAPINLLINCTTVGMTDNHCPVPDNIIEHSQAIVDIIYNPSQTSLLRKAADRGILNQNGIGMLLFQGVESFEIWTNKGAPIEIMKDTLIQSIL